MSVEFDRSSNEPLRLKVAYLLRKDKILYVSLRPQSKIDAEVYTNDGFTEHFDSATLCWDLFSGGVTGIEAMSKWFRRNDSIESHYPLHATNGKARGVIKRASQEWLQDLSITLFQDSDLAMRFAKGSPAEVVSLGRGGYLILDEADHVLAIVVKNIELRSSSAKNDKTLDWG